MNPSLINKPKIQLPKWALPLFKPKRYKVLYGGRGSAKSYSVAKALLLLGSKQPHRILCAREFQNSISDSVHKLLSDQIEEMGLQNFYTITTTSIRGKNGTEFIFKGVKMNVNSIKSMAGITILWLEEAQTVSKESWEILIPTIREPNSEIWVTFNPVNDDDPTYVRFVDKQGDPIKRDDLYCAKVNWRDNPWFPNVLKVEMNYAFEVDPDEAMHVWEGMCKTNSDAQILKGKWSVDDFEVSEEWDGPYFGADWGFSKDPTAITKSYIDSENKILYIDNEAGGVGIDLDDLPALFDTIPGIRSRLIKADNARPETISLMARRGFNIEAARKWSGSVEDGITFIRSFRKIVVRPKCVNTIQECKKYSYKTDRLTGAVTTDIVDDWNHYMDSLRYALDPLIGGGLSILDVL